MLKSALAMLVIGGLLVGCDSTSSLKELRTAEPAGDAYQAALAANYKEFAESKATAYDWGDSRYFADKGLMAAYGQAVVPEDPALWDVPADALSELTELRAKLLAAVEANKTTQPELTASAVVAYDRWVEAQPPGARSEQREVFLALLTKLSEAHVDSSPPPPPPLVPPVAAPDALDSSATTIYFPLDSDRLGDSAQAAVAELERYVKANKTTSIAINGHADRVGTEEYNMSLSERRARFVMEALAKAGVPATIMKYFAFGETDPAIPTADGVPEPKNRRVEIFIE
ncbi:MAG: OmpA family protein [Pseudomonadota bacterium]